MKINKKLLLCLALSVMCLGLFSACNGDDAHVKSATDLSSSSAAENSSEATGEVLMDGVTKDIADNLKDSGDSLSEKAD